MNNGPKIRLVLWKADKAMETNDRASVRATGLGLTDFAVLEVLLHKGALPVNTIGRKVLLTSGSITTAVDRLQQRGLVKRKRDPSDKRISNVFLTPKGKTLIERAYAVHTRNLDQATAVLTENEQLELIRLLKKLGLHSQALAVHTL